MSAKKLAESEHYNTQLIVACSNLQERCDNLLAALKAIHTTMRGDQHSECWTIRKFLDERDVFNDDIQSAKRLTEMAAEWAIAKAEGH